MTNSSNASGLQFLSVAEAATQLGMSRIKVREMAARGLIPSQRDNENRLRLDLTALVPGKLGQKGKKPTQSALMHILFDEIEELQDDLQGRTAEVVAWGDIADRQADALDAAADRIAQDAADKQRLEDMLERALVQLESAGTGAAEARLAQVSERALTALEATGEQLENSLSQSARFDALVDRALAVAAAGKAAGKADAQAIEATAARAMDMLGSALAQAETSQHAARRTGDMLERALQSGERMEQQIALRDREIETRNATVEQVLEMSERAVALAAVETPAPHKRSFWQWLMGR